MKNVDANGTFSIAPRPFTQVYVLLAGKPSAGHGGIFFTENTEKTECRNPDASFALTSRILISVAFVPLSHVYQWFRELKIFMLDVIPSLRSVNNWFSSNYVGLGTILRPASFPVHLWSCYQRTLDGEDRTNNFAEASHRRLQTILGVDHPSIGCFLKELKKVQKPYDHSYEECIAGNSAPKKKRMYTDADNRIFALVQKYERKKSEGKLLEYLRGLAHNFVMDQ